MERERQITAGWKGSSTRLVSCGVSEAGLLVWSALACPRPVGAKLCSPHRDLLQSPARLDIKCLLKKPLVVLT